MSAKQRDYVVTNGSVYTVRPVVTEHRFQIIEEIPTPPPPPSFTGALSGGAKLGVKLGVALIALIILCGLFGR